MRPGDQLLGSFDIGGILFIDLFDFVPGLVQCTVVVGQPTDLHRSARPYLARNANSIRNMADLTGGVLAAPNRERSGMTFAPGSNPTKLRHSLTALV
jgi:hypothetical protein